MGGGRAILAAPRTIARGSTAAALAVALSAALCGGCGSGEHAAAGGQLASETAEQILAASTALAGEAGSVSIRGALAMGPAAQVKLDLALTRRGGRGTVRFFGLEPRLIRTGGTLYVKGSPAIYRQLGVTRMIPSDTWLRLPARASMLAGFTDLAGETARILGAGGAVTKGGRTIVAGQPAIELKTQGKLYAGRLFVKATGAPYPLRLEKRGRERGRITFTGWNAPVAVAPPARSTSAEAGGSGAAAAPRDSGMPQTASRSSSAASGSLRAQLPARSAHGSPTAARHRGGRGAIQRPGNRNGLLGTLLHACSLGSRRARTPPEGSARARRELCRRSAGQGGG